MTSDDKIIEGLQYGLGFAREAREINGYCDRCPENVIAWRTEMK